MHNLSDRAHQAKQRYECEIVNIFNELKQIEPEVTEAVLRLYDGNLTAAGNFMTEQVIALAGQSPLQVLENDRRQDVLRHITRLEHGIFT